MNYNRKSPKELKQLVRDLRDTQQFDKEQRRRIIARNNTADSITEVIGKSALAVIPLSILGILTLNSCGYLTMPRLNTNGQVIFAGAVLSALLTTNHLFSSYHNSSDFMERVHKTASAIREQPSAPDKEYNLDKLIGEYPYA